MEADASSFLNSLALGGVLEGIGFGEASDSLANVGLGSRKLLDKASIYNDKFADEEENDIIGLATGEDFEDEVDAEFAEEDDHGDDTQQASSSQGLLRGTEVDDYDESDDEAVDGTAVPLDPALFGNSSMAVDDESMFNGEGGDSPATETAADASVSPEVDVLKMFPKFTPDGVLNFTDMVIPRPRKKQKVSKGIVKLALPPATELEQVRSTKDSIKDPSLGGPKMPLLTEMMGDLAPKAPKAPSQKDTHADAAYEELLAKNPDWSLPDAKTYQAAQGLIELETWEDQVDYANGPKEKSASGDLHLLSEAALANGDQDILPFRNAELDSGNWTQSVYWDPNLPYDAQAFTSLQIPANDPDLVIRQLTGADDEDFTMPTAEEIMGAIRGANRKRKTGQTDPYNLSNDKVYESLKENRKKVIRQTFGSLEVNHAWPAIKLQLPFFKTQLNKHEARSFHRPPIQFPSNVAITFSKVRSGKKNKKDEKKLNPVGMRGGKADNPIKNTADLSLKDTTPFVLTEFSEEYPPIMSNVGMGSILVNYYRKKDPKDEHFPRIELGESIMLDEKDESPFMKFGSVDPGQVVPAYYNNLIRAPLFRHTPNTYDFLCIRTTINGEVNYYLRDVKNLYVVGQTYPLQEVPGPHSRKVTTHTKSRLQLIATRLCDKDPGHRIQIRRLGKYFPDINDLQMRSKLKEFMEYVRRGADNGYWQMKPGSKSYEELLRECKPEDVSLYEAMQVGQRHLLDAGYGGKSIEETTVKEDEDDDSKMDTEQQLAPWITTKNFLNAAQSKAMLRLHGEGDPTGRGEGFNFVRVSMKDIFLREGESFEERQAEVARKPKSSHKYNVAEQQEIYKQEIDRIWRSQFKALSSKTPAKLTEEDEYRWQKRNREDNAQTPGSYAGTPGMPSPGTWGSGYNMDPEKPDNRVLRIKRQDQLGNWTTEIIKDSAVIQAYIKCRTEIEDEELRPEEVAPTGDAERDERARKKLEEAIAKMKHNQNRRMQRKEGIAAAAAAGQDPVLAARRARGPKQETTRRCGRCGQVGHMATNKKKCPMFSTLSSLSGPPSALDGAAKEEGEAPSV